MGEKESAQTCEPSDGSAGHCILLSGLFTFLMMIPPSSEPLATHLESRENARAVTAGGGGVAGAVLSTFGVEMLSGSYTVRMARDSQGAAGRTATATLLATPGPGRSDPSAFPVKVPRTLLVVSGRSAYAAAEEHNVCQYSSSRQVSVSLICAHHMI